MMGYTIAALAAYRRAGAERHLRTLTARTDDEVRAASAATNADLFVVHQAYFRDTGEVNSLAHCMSLNLETIKQVCDFAVSRAEHEASRP